jgi:transcription termination factor Rho
MSTTSISELKQFSPLKLVKVAEDMGVENLQSNKKQDIILAIANKKFKDNEEVIGGGVAEVMNDGYAFLRSVVNSYCPSADDIYVSPSQVRRFHIKTGDLIEGQVRPPKASERYLALVQISSFNGEPADQNRAKIGFENLTPLHPDSRLKLERGNGSKEDITSRIVDIVAPIGRGQRALIVSPPKAGKTMMLQNIAHSITDNYPDCEIMVLLVDERPEEVTEMQRSVKGEVIASTFDEAASRHVQVAEMVIAKAKRMVEKKKDVVVLLDSITRLARAYNSVTPSSGKVLTGGVDSNALQRPKRFFGAARNIEEGGSLTIIATALVETGSKMDEVIYEEFKGTGNNEIHLSRGIAEKRVYPAINITASGTRREELITTEEELRKMWILRKYLHSMEHNATEFLISRLKNSKTNEEFFESMLKGEKA